MSAGGRASFDRGACLVEEMNSTVDKLKLSVAILFIVATGAWFGAPLLTRGQGQMFLTEPIAALPWRSNKPFKEAGYVGNQACAECHATEFDSYHRTAMARALQLPADSEVLRARQRLTFRVGPYRYEIVRRGEESIYTVSDGNKVISVPIRYSFGQGKAGQTYILQYNGAFYESRVSYYREIDGLDFTIGYPRTVPSSLEDALGRAISMDEARSCFGCHATAAVAGRSLQLEHLMPGVGCEACHGPGRDHITAAEAGRFDDLRIFNPKRLSADALTQEFCGSCHRSAEDVLSLPQQGGINNVRFQPYRIFTSRGHDPNDPRLSCTACHNPHEHLRQDTAFYDARCTVCHRSMASLRSPALAKTESAQGRTAKACPVKAQDCVSCHMPKVEIPGAHFKFTDHRIRIAREGEPFPK